MPPPDPIIYTRSTSPDLFSDDSQTENIDQKPAEFNSSVLQVTPKAQNDLMNSVLQSAWAKEEPILMYYSGRNSCYLCKRTINKGQGTTRLDSLISHILIRHQSLDSAKVFIETFQKKLPQYQPPFLLEFCSRVLCRFCPRTFTVFADLRKHKCKGLTEETPVKVMVTNKGNDLVCPINCGSRWLWNRKRCRELYLISHLITKHAHDKNAYQAALNLAKSVQLATIYPELSVNRSFALQISNSQPFACSTCDMAFQEFSKLESHYRTFHKEEARSTDRTKRVARRFLRMSDVWAESESASMESTSTGGSFEAVVTPAALLPTDLLEESETEQLESEISGWLAECDPLKEGAQKRKIEILTTPILAKKKRRRGEEQDEEPIKEMANIKQLFQGKVSTSEMSSPTISFSLFEQLPNRQLHHLLPHLPGAPEPKDLSHLDDTSNLIRCTRCSFVGLTPSDYRRHYAFSHQTDSLETPSDSLTSFEAHQLHVCAACHKPFTNQKLLTLHVETHHGENDLCYSCPACSKLYKNVMALTAHMKLSHPKENITLSTLLEGLESS